MQRTGKKIKIRNKLREIGEQKDLLIHNLNFVSEETAICYFEKLRQIDRDIAETYRRLKSF